jgi:SAM-dependent methyltransferase
VAFALRHFGLGGRAVLDVGCGAGEHLAYFGPGSMGLELQERLVAEARARGLDVRQWDLSRGLPADLADRFDAVWCSNFLEHVMSPHLFLIDCRRVLRPGGLVVAVVPLTRHFALGPWRGRLAADHVSFFTPATLRLTVERAGYRVVFLGAHSFPWLPRWAAAVLRAVAPGVVVAARPAEGFQYPAKAHKRLVDGRVECLA